MNYGLDKGMDQDLSWNSLIYRYNEGLTKFVLNAHLQTLPTPDNLRRWNIAKGIKCGLCRKPDVTLKHCLAGCLWVLNVESKMKREDRYLWRHNCLLLLLARCIVAKLNQVNAEPEDSKRSTPATVSFVKAGQTAKGVKQPQTTWLQEARDWVCNFDLPEFRQGREGQMVFPHDICTTSKRIDGYIVSRSKRICILGPEMTAPMDDNVGNWHVTKESKYRQMVSDISDWTFHHLAVEVGALGWIPPSTHALLKKVGFSNKEVKDIIKDLQYLARKCSYVIYLNRSNQDFHPWRLEVDRHKDVDLMQNIDKYLPPKLPKAPQIVSSANSVNSRATQFLALIEPSIAPKTEHKEAQSSKQIVDKYYDRFDVDWLELEQAERDHFEAKYQEELDIEDEFLC